MIIADTNTYLGYICSEVDRMKEGEKFSILLSELKENIRSFYHNDSLFSPADLILENIVGSAYTHSYEIYYDGNENERVIFTRHKNTGFQYYKSPDRR